MNYRVYLLLPFLCLYLLHAPLTQARWFNNLDTLKAQLEDSDHASFDFLQAIDDHCRLLHADYDATYYKNSADEAQSPHSAQSRLCATVIYQHSPVHNPFKMNMRSCSKFTGPMQQCCIVLHNAFNSEPTKALAEKMCQDVPSHFDLVNAYRQTRQPVPKTSGCFARAKLLLERLWPDL